MGARLPNVCSGYKLVISNQPTEKSNSNFRHKTLHLDLTKLGRPVCGNR